MLHKVRTRLLCDTVLTCLRISWLKVKMTVASKSQVGRVRVGCHIVGCFTFMTTIVSFTPY